MCLRNSSLVDKRRYFTSFSLHFQQRLLHLDHNTISLNSIWKGMRVEFRMGITNGRSEDVRSRWDQISLKFLPVFKVIICVSSIFPVLFITTMLLFPDASITVLGEGNKFILELCILNCQGFPPGEGSCMHTYLVFLFFAPNQYLVKMYWSLIAVSLRIICLSVSKTLLVKVLLFIFS